MEIFSFGNGDFLFQVFSAIKGIMGDGSFSTLMRIVILAGFLVLLYQLFFSMNIATVGIGTIRHYIFVVVIISIIFVPKTDVVIRDEIKNTQVSVTNVPLGIGLMAHFFTTAEKGITRMTENYFSTPDDLKFYKTGYAFSVILMDTLKAATPSDPYFKRTLDEYIVNCFFHDVLWGDINLDNFVNQSNNLFADMAPQHSKNIFTRIFQQGGTSSVTCQSAYTHLSAALGAMSTKALDDLNKTMGLNVATSAAIAAQHVLDISASTTQILNQAIAANAIKSAMASASLNTGLSGEAVAYATALAEQQQRSSWAVGGELSKKYIPIMRQVLEAFVYGLFPVIFIMMLTPAGPKVLKMYFTLLVWLLMWSPLFAILNLIVNTRARGIMSPIYGYYTLGNMPFIYQSTNDLTAMAGYLAWLVPTLGFAISNLSGYAITAMASSIAGSVTSSAGGSAHSISSPQGASSTAQMAGHMQAAALMGSNSWSVAQSATTWSQVVNGLYYAERGLGRAVGGSTGKADAETRAEKGAGMSATERVARSVFASTTKDMGASGEQFDKFMQEFAQKYAQINPNASSQEVMRATAAYLAAHPRGAVEARKALGSIANADLERIVSAGSTDISRKIADAETFGRIAEQHGISVGDFQKAISTKQYSQVGAAISDFAKQKGISLYEAAQRMGEVAGLRESIAGQVFDAAGYDKIRHAEINKALNEAAKFEMTYQFAQKFFGAKDRQDYEAQYKAHLAHHGQETYTLTAGGAAILNQIAKQMNWGNVEFKGGERVTMAMNPETGEVTLAKGEIGAKSEKFDITDILSGRQETYLNRKVRDHRDVYRSGSETLGGHTVTVDNTNRNLSGTVIENFDVNTSRIDHGTKIGDTALQMALTGDPNLFRKVIEAYQSNNLAKTDAEMSVVSSSVASGLRSFIDQTGGISHKTFGRALAEAGLSFEKGLWIIKGTMGFKGQAGVEGETAKNTTVNLIAKAINEVQTHALKEGTRLGYSGNELRSHVAAKVAQFTNSLMRYAKEDRAYGAAAPGGAISNLINAAKPNLSPEGSSARGEKLKQEMSRKIQGK